MNLSELILKAKSSGDHDAKKLTPRVARLLFLSSNRYSSHVEWNDTTVSKSSKMDADFSHFFERISSELRDLKRNREEIGESDVSILTSLSAMKAEVVDRLLDDFDFPSAFERIHKFTRFFLSLVAGASGDAVVVMEGTMVKSRDTVREILESLGFEGELSYDGSSSSRGEGGKNVDEEEERRRTLEILLDFRTAVREEAIVNKNANLLRVCDEVRKRVEGEFGIKLVDGKKKKKE